MVPTPRPSAIHRAAFTLLLWLSLSLPSPCQVANEYELHKDRVIGADVIEFQFSNTSAGGDRAIAFDAIEFLDASSQLLSTLDFGTPEAQHYFGPSGYPDGDGWLEDEGGAPPDVTFVWARGTRARIIYDTPQQALTMRLHTARPLVSVTTTIVINGDAVGSVFHDARAPGGNWFSYDVSLGAVRRKLSIAPPTGGAAVTLSSVQLVNAQNQVTWSATGLALSPGMDLEIQTLWEPCDVLVTVEASGVQPDDRLRVYVNRYENAMLVFDRPLQSGLATYTSAEPDPLMRHGGFRTPTPEADRWVEDFRFDGDVSRSAGTAAQVSDGVLSLWHRDGADGEIYVFLDAHRDIRIGANGARYLVLRIRAPQGVNYFVRMEDPSHALFARPLSAMENRSGTGDWELLVFDLERYLRYSLGGDKFLRRISFVAVNTVGPTPYPTNSLEVDFFHVGAAPVPNPPDVTRSEFTVADSAVVPLLDGLDNDLDGYVDRADSDYAAFFPRQVVAYYHAFYGSPDLESGHWGAWAGTQFFVYPDGSISPTGVVFAPDNFIGSGLQTRRNIASHYWPLKYSAEHRWNYGYEPPMAESDIDWGTRAGLNYRDFSYGPDDSWGYDVVSKAHIKNQLRLASDFGIDALALDVGGQNPAVTYARTMHTMLEAAQELSDEYRPVGVAAFYNYYSPSFSPIVVPARDWTEMAADLHYILREYAGHPAYFHPWRNALQQPQPFQRLWDSPLILAPTGSGLRPWDTWNQAFAALACPMRCAFNGDISLPFRPSGEWVHFRFTCSNPVESGPVWLGMLVASVGVARSDLTRVANDAAGTRLIDVGSALDSADLVAPGGVPADPGWSVPSLTDAFPEGSYRYVQSVTPQSNQAYFRLFLDDASGPDAARFLTAHWLATEPSGGRGTLEFWDAAAGQYRLLGSFGSVGSLDVVSGINWAQETFRLRYPGDPSDLADLCQPDSSPPLEMFCDTPAYVRPLSFEGGGVPDTSSSLFTGVATYGPSCYDTGVHVNYPLRNAATARTGFKTALYTGTGQGGTDRLDGLNYRRWWEQCLLADPEYVFVCTFNEWNEGTQIEPTVEYGFRYLQLTLTYSLIYKMKLSVERLPSQSGLLVTRFDPETFLTDPGRAYTQVIVCQTMTAETLRFRDMFEGALPAVYRILRDGVSYDTAMFGREGDDLVLRTQDSPTPVTYEIRLEQYPRRGPVLHIY